MVVVVKEGLGLNANRLCDTGFIELAGEKQVLDISAFNLTILVITSDSEGAE